MSWRPSHYKDDCHPSDDLLTCAFFSNLLERASYRDLHLFQTHAWGVPLHDHGNWAQVRPLLHHHARPLY